MHIYVFHTLVFPFLLSFQMTFVMLFLSFTIIYKYGCEKIIFYINYHALSLSLARWWRCCSLNNINLNLFIYYYYYHYHYHYYYDYDYYWRQSEMFFKAGPGPRQTIHAKCIIFVFENIRKRSPNWTGLSLTYAWHFKEHKLSSCIKLRQILFIY